MTRHESLPGKSLSHVDLDDDGLPFDADPPFAPALAAGDGRVLALPVPRVTGQRGTRLAVLPAEKQPLQLALFSLPTLCCCCHRLKGRNGHWTRRRVEHEWFPETPFSHGICPTCAKRQYPTAYRRTRQRRAAEAALLPAF